MNKPVSAVSCLGCEKGIDEEECKLCFEAVNRDRIKEHQRRLFQDVIINNREARIDNV